MIYKSIYIIIIFSTLIFAQPDQIVLTAGDKSVSAEQFKFRYELTPMLGKQISEENGSLKNEFVYTLIAEKLWSEEASSKKFDTIPRIKTAIDEIKKMYVRDALYKKVVKDQVVVTDKMLEDEIIKQSAEYNISLLKGSKEEVFNFYKLLKSGYSFDSLFISNEGEKISSEEKQKIFNSLDDSIKIDLIENDRGRNFSEPFSFNGNWYIISLSNISVNPFPDIEQIRIEAAKEEENRLYQSYLRKLLSDKKINVNAELFNKLSASISELLEFRSEEYDTLFLEPEDVEILLSYFSENDLNRIFINFENDPVTLKDFIYDLTFYGLKPDSYKPEILKPDLSGKIKKMIEWEILAREGLKQGLDSLPEVEEEFEMWRDYYLYYAYKNSYHDSVSVDEQDVESYFQKRSSDDKITLVNIIEVNVTDLQAAEIVLGELGNGVDIRNVAQSRSINKNKSVSYETGFLPADELGEVGRLASQMKVGETYGPLQLKKGFSIFKLIGKKEIQKSELKDSVKFIQRMKPIVKEDLYSKKIIEKTVELAEKYGIKINNDVLKNIKVTNLNSFMIKRFGFGGSLTAVPMIANFSQWYQQYKSQEKISF